MTKYEFHGNMKSMNILYEDYVKLMERGQITLPILIRQKLAMSPKDFMRVRLLENNDVVISPVAKKVSFLAQILEDHKNDKRIYWTREDEKRRLRIRKLSDERLKKLDI